MSLSGSDLTRLLVATGVFGVVAGIVGMGGGMVISPVMISMGVLPQVGLALDGTGTKHDIGSDTCVDTRVSAAPCLLAPRH